MYRQIKMKQCNINGAIVIAPFTHHNARQMWNLIIHMPIVKVQIVLTCLHILNVIVNAMVDFY